MRRSSFGERAYEFYASLNTPVVPRTVDVMNPYAEPEVKAYLKTFLDKYFNDDRARIPILGSSFFRPYAPLASLAKG